MSKDKGEGDKPSMLDKLAVANPRYITITSGVRPAM